MHVAVLAIVEAAREPDETGGDDAFARAILRLAFGQQVAGDLFDDELIVGQILIERIDDVIPVKVRLWNGSVGAVARSVGVAREVEPMPAPTLAVVLRSEEFIDDFFECAG